MIRSEKIVSETNRKIRCV